MELQKNWFSRLPWWKKVLLVFLVMGAVGAFIDEGKPVKTTTKTAPAAKQVTTKEQQAADRKKTIENQFSAWNGAHMTLERSIKAAMNNPKSFEHIQSGYTDMGDYILVETKFRGTNAFGAVVMNSVRARVDLQGNILEIISQQ